MAAKTKSLTLKVVRVGNSRGVRLPKALLERHAIGNSVTVEERAEGLLLRAGRDKRLTWADTYKEMAREKEDWSDLASTLGDGLDPEERW
jgi:antitoxin MazE